VVPRSAKEGFVAETVSPGAAALPNNGTVGAAAGVSSEGAEHAQAATASSAPDARRETVDRSVRRRAGIVG
jgi:hypothetical protein